MYPIQSAAGQVISTILKHDRKVNTYKIALLRAINDLVLTYPDVRLMSRDVAVPLRLIAEYWLAYYWPFADPTQPVLQGQQAAGRQDMSFRNEIEALRLHWEAEIGERARPSDGFYLIHEARVERRRLGYSDAFWQAYGKALKAIEVAIEKPIRYAGVGEYTVFAKPLRAADLPADCVRLPISAGPGDRWLVIAAELWTTFLQLSLWVEALAIHEWSLYTERVRQPQGSIDRGAVYRLLTDRPDNRRPLTWEHNQIDLLIMEGSQFTCPWSARHLRAGEYALDHIVPLAVYPTNELWNLVPADPEENRRKTDLIPSANRMARARPCLVRTYGHYQSSETLAPVLLRDSTGRFLSLADGPEFVLHLTDSVVDFVAQLGEARNLPQYE